MKECLNYTYRQKNLKTNKDENYFMMIKYW